MAGMVRVGDSTEVSVVFVVLLLFSVDVCLTSETADDPDGPIVSTTKGKIRGLRYELPHLGATGEAYLGIPFAAPPVGPRRFRYPEPVEPWGQKDVVLNATRMPNSCSQVPDLFFGPSFWGSNMWNPNTPVNEDCLYLNIWVPRNSSATPPPPRLPVMVWIFGGGFYSGTTTLTLYDGRALASLNDVIVVSIGYRLGAFGFLCLDHPSAPCNMGLFDQLLGLDWVQRNIDRFGGDPDSVTLFGESAGAVSVSLHLFSPLSRDKFHRAILQSGTANMPWATLSLAEGVRRSREMAVGYVGCEDDPDPHELAKCLREFDADFLLEQQWVSRGILQFPFLPVVDGLFLLESPATALRSGRFKRCPVLLGSNRNEGSWFLIYEFSDRLTLEKTDMSREEFLSNLRHVFYHYPQYPSRLNSTQVLDAIGFEYSNWTDLNDSLANAEGLDNAVGDSQFVCPLNEFASAYARAGQDVYMYYLTQRYQSHPWPEWMGVMHGDDVLFVFGHVIRVPEDYSEEDRKLSRRVMTFWTNFAKTGNPNSRVTDEEQQGTASFSLPSSSSSSTSSASAAASAAAAAATITWPRYTASAQEYLELNEHSIHANPSSSSSSSSSTASSSFSSSSSSSSSAPGYSRRGPRIRQCVFWMEYLPKLITTTADLEEKETEWKRQFAEWSTSHLPEWKEEFDRRKEHEQEECEGRR